MKISIILIFFGPLFFLSLGFAHSIKGSLDICHIEQGQYCYAWACNSDRPDRLTMLRLSFDGGLIFTPAVLANLVRETAVGEACGENKYRGAFFGLDRAIVDYLSDGGLHEVTLEALDTDANNYVSLGSIKVQGKAIKPVVLFKQSPYQGVIINPASIDEIFNLPKGVFGVANWDGVNFPVDVKETIQIVIDSREYNSSDLNTPLLRSTPFYIFPEKINPWSMGRKISLSASLGVAAAERWAGGEAYVVIYTLWSNNEGHKFWLGWQLFDLRAQGEFVSLDDCPVCTGLPIVAGHINGGFYGNPAVDSARFLNFPGLTPPVKYSVQVTLENFTNAVNALQSITNSNFSDDPLSYNLESIWLNPEVFVGPPGSGGILDIRFFDLSIGIQ